jgi:hypothetical protein
MQWEDIDLSKMVVAGARFGGPVAVIRDEGKLVRLGAEAAHPILKIFSASGLLLSAIKWTESRIVDMAWSDSEQLVVVLRSGSVCVYSMHGDLINLFSIGLIHDEVLFPLLLTVAADIGAGGKCRHLGHGPCRAYHPLPAIHCREPNAAAARPTEKPRLDVSAALHGCRGAKLHRLASRRGATRRWFQHHCS